MCSRGLPRANPGEIRRLGPGPNLPAAGDDCMTSTASIPEIRLVYSQRDPGNFGTRRAVIEIRCYSKSDKTSTLTGRTTRGYPAGVITRVRGNRGDSVMKKLLLVSTALTVLFAGSALAADLRRPAPAYTPSPPPPPVFSWTGFYIGGNLGRVMGKRNRERQLVWPQRQFRAPADLLAAANSASTINSATLFSARNGISIGLRPDCGAEDC